ncbi:hypothetical protein GF336_01345 [Candidatus Woesearchaeota archaeon]|nr:hypothetical protein [Candidatus Woesearchaeota archaeon]
MPEVNISYETLFELLRREKTRDELQKLEDSFFDDLLEYLKEKDEKLEVQRKKTDLFSIGEKEKAEKQISNIRKILNELYERRERKIVNMAMDCSRTNGGIVDTSAMLAIEKQFFQKNVDIFDCFRKGVLLNILELKEPDISRVKSDEDNTENAENRGNAGDFKDASEYKKEEAKEENEKQDKETAEESGEDKDENTGQQEESNKGSKNVIFKENIEKFLGDDLEEYGPFEKDQTAELPSGVADILINSGKAESA